MTMRNTEANRYIGIYSRLTYKFSKIIKISYKRLCLKVMRNNNKIIPPMIQYIFCKL